MTEWRWDQGRVLYFQFDVIKEMAKVLVHFENRNINDNFVNDELRSSLTKNVGMPFAPNHYKVNRNYSRVFQCAIRMTWWDYALLAIERFIFITRSGSNQTKKKIFNRNKKP